MPVHIGEIVTSVDLVQDGHDAGARGVDRAEIERLLGLLTEDLVDLTTERVLEKLAERMER